MSKRKEQPVAVAPVSPSPSPESAADNKRKRKEADVPDDDKLEIDVSLPEPPSKKAKRAEKKKSKTKKPSTTPTDAVAKPIVVAAGEDNADPESLGLKPDASTTAPTRSEYGIWIGNLPWVATKDSLRQFLNDEGKVWEREIVRVHMPAPMIDRSDTRVNKPQNKGFAYVDFTTQEVLDRALALSEKLMTGRRVLIKNAKSFEGRPDKTAAAAKTAGADGEVKGGFVSKKEPAKRIFVGNLNFDVTQEDLLEHFGQAGEIEDIHMATFEDSGKCKGFAWVRFKEIEGAEAAVRGFVYKTLDGDEDVEDDEAGGSSADDGKKKPKAKKHKQHLNRMQGRELRREFAEDAQTRYKKRYGKKDEADGAPAGRDRRDPSSSGAASVGAPNWTPGYDGDGGKKRHEKDQRRKERRKRHEKLDARTVAPGQALANAPRSSSAIVAGQGKKVTFD
ncbi:hypothetical protein LTR36_007908 [Oleoguttula mirabilis]|uniref:RRM domain-containing protein n=1 Tax=Oleoguttula mirabilis TaxID=1507867 RepID=A0AAV9JAN7_9PEZI|nr:hypothetical protein LTR36_007908 [Oleoguttula mirabilis]